MTQERKKKQLLSFSLWETVQKKFDFVKSGGGGSLKMYIYSWKRKEEKKKNDFYDLEPRKFRLAQRK